MSSLGREQRQIDILCRDILKTLLDRANKGERISFEGDMGGNTLTILVESGPNQDHTHVGCPGEDFNLLVKNLHATLTESGPHLSWARRPPA